MCLFVCVYKCVLYAKCVCVCVFNSVCETMCVCVFVCESVFVFVCFFVGTLLHTHTSDLRGFGHPLVPPAGLPAASLVTQHA